MVIMIQIYIVKMTKDRDWREDSSGSRDPGQI